MLKVTLSDLIDDGELEGYRRGSRYNALTDGIEEEVCAAASCPFCGHEGLEVQSFLRRYTNEWDGWERVSRRAFACCPACRHCEEI